MLILPLLLCRAYVPLLHNQNQHVVIYVSRNATPGDALAKILIEIIIKKERTGARVIGITGDENESNRRMKGVI